MSSLNKDEPILHLQALKSTEHTTITKSTLDRIIELLKTDNNEIVNNNLRLYSVSLDFESDKDFFDFVDVLEKTVEQLKQSEGQKIEVRLIQTMGGLSIFRPRTVHEPFYSVSLDFESDKNFFDFIEDLEKTVEKLKQSEGQKITVSSANTQGGISISRMKT